MPNPTCEINKRLERLAVLLDMQRPYKVCDVLDAAIEVVRELQGLQETMELNDADTA